MSAPARLRSPRCRSALVPLPQPAVRRDDRLRLADRAERPHRPAMSETPAAEPAAGFALRVVAQIPRLRRYATAWLHNVADADDLVQDTVERALQRQESLRDPARLGAWLLAILHNLHRSNLRRARRHGPLLAVDSLRKIGLAAPKRPLAVQRNGRNDGFNRRRMKL